MPKKAPNPTILSTNFLSTSSLSFGNSALEDLTLSSLMPNKTPNHTLPSTNFIFTSPSKSLKILQIHSLPGPKEIAFQIPRETTLQRTKKMETILHRNRISNTTQSILFLSRPRLDSALGAPSCGGIIEKINNLDVYP